jgi:hypothetical protein
MKGNIQNLVGEAFRRNSSSVIINNIFAVMGPTAVLDTDALPRSLDQAGVPISSPHPKRTRTLVSRTSVNHGVAIEEAGQHVLAG